MSGETLSAIDDHFWDWILWLLSKDAAGHSEVVQLELDTMFAHILNPMGVPQSPVGIDEAVSAYLEARARQERVHRVTVSRRLEHEVLKAFQRLPRPVRDSLSASPLDSVTDHPAESPVPGTGGNHPVAPSIEIRLAGREDIGVAAHILEEAIAWARLRGFDSWAPGEFASPEGGGRLRLLQAVETGGLYLVFVEGQAVGTMSLLPEGPLFWPGSPPVALYLHRFAIRGPHTGRGVGVAALAWAEHEVMRRGRRLIRLDCLADNPGIRAYYERAGFEHRGDVEVEGTRFSLYEREAGKLES
ncbi:MAG TPA: GNAT family N-acetyltransferase [Actinomycetota bacterium]|nr:GNAT family N-acetyltransferase [Actinomycetota bacterium]